MNPIIILAQERFAVLRSERTSHSLFSITCPSEARTNGYTATIYQQVNVGTRIAKTITDTDRDTALEMAREWIRTQKA
jgi:hypothetical protein